MLLAAVVIFMSGWVTYSCIVMRSGGEVLVFDPGVCSK